MALGVALVAAASLLSVQDQAQQAPAGRGAGHRDAARQNQDTGQEGQRVFEENCARCHKSPDGFARRITGTIVRHMRVRANLSRHDEQTLLRYFNP
jgi:cytochrome c5